MIPGPARTSRAATNLSSVLTWQRGGVRPTASGPSTMPSRRSSSSASGGAAPSSVSNPIGREASSRAFLYGVVRNVALRRAESAQACGKEQAPPDGFDPGQVAANDTRLSLAFDRAWARALVAQAAAQMAAEAERADAAARGRVELLRLRFHEGLPIREIARRRGCDPDAVHRDYARARQEFRAALTAVVAFHHPGTPAEVERTCGELLAILG